MIFPDKTWNLSNTLIVETKFGSLKELASKEELFRYLYSAQQSSIKELRNSIWEF